MMAGAGAGTTWMLRDLGWIRRRVGGFPDSDHRGELVASLGIDMEMRMGHVPRVVRLDTDAWEGR